MADVVETVFRFRADAAALRGLAMELERLHASAKKVQEQGLDKLAAGMSKFTAGAVLGGAVLGWFAAATAATTAYASAMVGLTTSAAKSADELQKLGLITSEQAEAAKRGGAAVTALDTTWKLFTFTLAEDVTPTVATLSRLLVAAGLAASDMAAKVHAGRLLLQGGATAVGGIIGGGMGAQTVGGLVGLGSAFGQLGGVTGGYIDQAEQLIRSLAAQDDAHKKTASAAGKQAAEIKRLTVEQQKLLGLNRFMIGATNTTNQGATDEGAALLALLPAGIGGAGRKAGEQTGEILAAHKALTEGLKSMWLSTASTIGGAIGALGGIFAQNSAAAKAFGMISVAISTGVAVMQALASPPGPPYTIPLAVAVGAFGAVQLAAVAAGKLAGGGGLSGRLGGAGAFGGAAGLGTSTPASAFFEPSPQSGETRGSARSRGDVVTVQTVEGYAPVRDLIEAVNRKGGKMRLRMA